MVGTTVDFHGHQSWNAKSIPLHLCIYVKVMIAEDLFSNLPETFRFTEAKRLGVRYPDLKRWLSKAEVERISRGIYRKTSSESDGLEDLLAVCKRVPSGVLCLESALYLHELGTQIPRKVTIAVDRTAWVPRIDSPPSQIVRLSGKAFSEGIEHLESQGTNLRVYSKAKTVADCFKFRNKLGEEVAVEALRALVAMPGFTADKLLHFAKICRVDAVIRPYLVAVT
jgi:predicted transcriptional regulator of viral defense system